MKKAEIKERIKLALELRELTQSELAEKAHIDKGQLSSYLSGKYKPRQNNIDALSIALDVNEAWLMGFDVPMERQSSVISSNKLYCNTEKEKSLLQSYRKLNPSNQDKGLSYIENLLTTQRMEDEVFLNAAHDFGATPEQKKHTDDIMQDDSEWE